MTPRQRVGCVFEHPTLSGGERSMLEAMRRLLGRGYEFLALAPPGGLLTEALAELGVPTLAFERTRRPGDSKTPAERTAERLVALLRGAVDIIHGNSLSTAAFTGLAGERLGLPAVAHVREIEGMTAARIERVCRNQRLVAVSDGVRRHLLELGVAAERVVTIHNGIDLERLDPARVRPTLRRELGIAASAPLIGWIGQISLRKAPEVFLEVVLRLAGELPELHAVLVGERFSTKEESRALEAELRDRIHRAGLERRCHLLGWRNDVPAILRDLDLLVHTARQEPLGRVLLEAAALAVPAVATRVGGTPEIIIDEKTGWLVPPDDPDATVAAIERALGDTAVRQEAGREARQRAERSFGIDDSVDRIDRLYQELKGVRT